MEGVQVIGNNQCSVAFREQQPTVFRCRLNMGSDVDAVTKSGRLFHTCAAATGKARSPTVDSRNGGTTRVGVDAKRRRRRIPRSVTRRKLLEVVGEVRWRYATDTASHKASSRPYPIKMLNVAYGQSFSNKWG